jgi:hypothetical protein
MVKENNFGEKLVRYGSNVIPNRLNGLVEFGFYLDEMSEILSHQLQNGKGNVSKDVSIIVETIRDDYKQMVSNRMNELTKKNLNIKD